MKPNMRWGFLGSETCRGGKEFPVFFPRKLYVLLSVLLCLLLSGLGVFFLFPHSVLVDDDGIKVVQVWFDRKNSAVLLAITVNFPWIWENKSPGE